MHIGYLEFGKYTLSLSSIELANSSFPFFRYQNSLATNKDNLNNRFGAQISYLKVNKEGYTQIVLKRMSSLQFFTCCSVLRRRENIKAGFYWVTYMLSILIFLIVSNPAEISRRTYNSLFSDTAHHLFPKWKISIMLYLCCPLSAKSKITGKRSLFILLTTNLILTIHVAWSAFFK